MALKKYLYKVFDSNNVYITNWNDVISEFEYTQEINTGGSAVEISLGRTSDPLRNESGALLTEDGDTFITEGGDTITAVSETSNATGFGTDVALNNNVEIYVVYGESGTRITEADDTRITEDGDTRVVDSGAPSGRIIFKGYISKIISQYGQSETLQVTLLSHGAELDNYLIESGTDTQITYNSYDPSNILKDVINKYRSAGGIVSFDSTTIETTGSTVSYLIKVNTALEAIDRCLKLAPTDWYWYLDQGTNLINFRAKPTIPSHTFVLGKHIENFSVEQHIEDITNVVYFSGGDIGGGVNLFNKYTDTTSISNYRRGLEKISDNRVTDDTSAQIISESEINRKKNPIYRSSITILDTAYNIEDIVVGQLVAFDGFGNFIDDLTLQITSLRYSPDFVTMQLGSNLPAVSKRVEDIKRQLHQKDVESNPSAP
jgi:hypothetical protein